MAVFGVLLPALIAWALSGWLAGKLKKWWGSVLSVTVGFILAVVLSAAAHGVLADFLFDNFDTEGWARAFATSFLPALCSSVWSVVQSRRRNS